jgi:TRAP-type mannitol/chloroaromatic compound transport system permease small subunit
VFAAQTLAVVLRYLFSIGFVELQNFINYCFAAFCVLIIPLALRRDKHVRVDVFRAGMSSGTARNADVLAIVFLLSPVFGLALWHATPVILYSWSVLEGSRDPGGLPGYFVVLTALPIMCASMLIQGLAIWIDRSLIHDTHEKSEGD